VVMPVVNTISRPFIGMRQSLTFLHYNFNNEENSSRHENRRHLLVVNDCIALELYGARQSKVL